MYYIYSPVSAKKKRLRTPEKDALGKITNSNHNDNNDNINNDTNDTNTNTTSTTTNNNNSNIIHVSASHRGRGALPAAGS